MKEYDTQANLPFRRRVFPSHLDGKPITGIDIENAIAGPTFSELYGDDVVGLCCLGILQLVLLGPLYVDQPTNEDDPTTYSIFGYTWAFKTWILESFRLTAIWYFNHFNRYPRVAAWSKKKGSFLVEMVIPFFERNIHAARLTPDDNEARSEWWISSKAYFDGFIDQVERVPFDLSRQNMYEIPSDTYQQFVEQKINLEINKKDVDDIKEQMLKFREEMNARPMRQKNTVPINVGQHYGFSDFSQFQSMQGHANISFSNMGTPSNFQTTMRSQNGSSDWERQMPKQSASHYWQPSPQPCSYYSFGQVPSHIGRPNLKTTIETQHDVDGIVDQPISKTKNKGKKANLSPLNLGGVLEGYNEEDNNVTFLGSQFTGNILFYENVDPKKDPHVIGTLDGSMLPYPSWNDVNWVFFPIHVAGNHFPWVLYI
nr:phospholipase-like protein [Tanacetum cinerariifolium]